MTNTALLTRNVDMSSPTTRSWTRPVPRHIIELPEVRKRLGVSDHRKLKFLGHGQYANVYDIGDGRVLKLTYDKKDAHAFANILHRPAPAFAVILDVFKIPVKPYVYGIVAEKLKPLPQNLANEWSVFSELLFYVLRRPLAREKAGINSDWARWVYKKISKWASSENPYENRAQWPFDDILWEDRYKPAIQKAIATANLQNPRKLKFLIKLAKSLEHARIKWWDLHQGNIMIRPDDGRLVIADLGLSSSPSIHIPTLGKERGPKIFGMTKADNYEDYCDFGGQNFSKLVAEEPACDSLEFQGYVAANNQGDRDMGELEDIAYPELKRLAAIFLEK